MASIGTSAWTGSPPCSGAGSVGAHPGVAQVIIIIVIIITNFKMLIMMTVTMLYEQARPD